MEALEKKGAVRLFLDDAITVTADRMLVATGRRARTAELGLEAAGVAIDRGFVVTDAGLARRLE